MTLDYLGEHTTDETQAEQIVQAYLELLEPSGLRWSVAVLGGDVVGCGMAERAIRRGGHVRVGLEDYAGPAVPTDLELLDERRFDNGVIYVRHAVRGAL